MGKVKYRVVAPFRLQEKGAGLAAGASPRAGDEFECAEDDETLAKLVESGEVELVTGGKATTSTTSTHHSAHKAKK